MYTKTAQKNMKHDWHPADIGAALKKAGWNWSTLSAHHGYAGRTTLHRVTTSKWPKGERLVAEAIGIKPEDIWPSRYQKKFKRPVASCNVNNRKAA